MQERHLNRKQYFCELANTSRDYYIDYLDSFIMIAGGTRVLEIGCGEGGNLLPFAQMGCMVTGIDINAERIDQAKAFFAEAHEQGEFKTMDFIHAEKPTCEEEKYDIILLHDVIEHIEQPYKDEFIANIKPYLRAHGVLFVGFPAWQMPFGGHQQICRGIAGKLPFIHLLPNALYTRIVKACGNGEGTIKELLSIKRAKMSIEGFEQLIHKAGFTIERRTLWFINPHYEQKFHLRPRLLGQVLSALPYIRNIYTTSAFYLLKLKRS